MLAEVADASADGARPGALQRRDLDVYAPLLARLEGAGTLLVTGDAERKGGVAVGLAATAAATGAKTALLECDLLRPELAATLGLAPTPGLHEYLRWTASAEQILQALVLAGPGSAGATDPLVCVVAGEPSPHGGTLLAAESFLHAVAMLRAAYERVVVSGPSFEGDDFALARAAAPADAVLACVDRAAARGRTARRLGQRLDWLGVRRAGLVVVS